LVCMLQATEPFGITTLGTKVLFYFLYFVKKKKKEKKEKEQKREKQNKNKKGKPPDLWR